MKKLYTITLALLSTMTVVAQPTITEVNMPVIGDMMPRSICSDIPNATTLDAETGANYTWDFSGLTQVSTANFNFIDPANSLWPNDFMNSDICGVEPDQDAFSFYSSSAAALETEGQRIIISPGDTAETTYSNSEVILNLPAEYQDSNNDAFSGTGAAGGFALTANGTLDYTIDGYGTLQLPNGTYQNVIRYRADRSETFTVGAFPPSTTTKDQWIWVSSDYRFWLLLMETITDPINGVSHNVWYQTSPIPVNPTSIADIAEEDFLVYPNPVAANGTLQLSRALSADESVQLFDTQGRMVKNMNEATSTVSLDGVNAGIYVLKILNGNGRAISTQKLIVQ